MICTNPIDAAVLADYWLAALEQTDEEVVEEHLLGCDRCGASLREVIALAEALRNLAREGSLRMIVSDAFLKCAATEGLHVREYAPPAGSSVECTVTADDDILIGRLAADLSGAGRVDLCLCDEGGVEHVRLQDIPAHAATRGVNYQESITFAKASRSTKMVTRLVAVDEAGGERLLGEYLFNHTRSLPGEGGESLF